MGGQSYWVGEKGRELFTPSTNGSVSKGGVGNVTISPNFHVVVENKGGGQPMRSTGAQMESGPGGMKQLRVFVETIVADGLQRRGNPINTAAGNAQRMRGGVPVAG